jgi:hypothetical protein
MIPRTHRDSLLRHLSSHAKSPARSSQLKQGKNDEGSDQLHASDNEDSQELQGATTLPEQRQLNPDQTSPASIPNVVDAISSANIEDEPDIDVPPELVAVQPNSNEHCINSSVELHNPPSAASNDAHAMESAETYGSSGSNYDADVLYRRRSVRTHSPSDLSEYPEALYSDVVDVHARKWLKDFCA